MIMKTLASLNIGRDKPTFIIAEAGINHNGSLKLALKLIDAAKKAGADAIKFQTYLTEKRVKKDNPVYGILKEAELSPADFKKLQAYAKRRGIIFFSTPFDEESVDALRRLKVPLIKVASFDVVNHKLLKKIASAKIPVIISRGMASQRELDAAIQILKGKVDFAVLHCVSAYPTPKSQVNLKAVQTLLSRYTAPIGYSDHTLDLDPCVYAVAMGARILEKHFTLNKKMKGPDQALSADPKEFAMLVSRVREAQMMLGSGALAMSKVEKPAGVYRRPSRV